MPRGLPAPLPAGETILWQGAPRWQGLARRAFHVRKLAFYFAALLAASAIGTYFPTDSAGEPALKALQLATLAMTALGVLATLAWLTGRTTVYTITNRRVVMQIGIALPVTLNLPFRGIQAAGLHLNSDGTGDITLSLAPASRIAYAHLWPHARPWRFSHPEPMLRAIADAATVGELLADALADGPAPEPIRQPAAHAAAPAGQAAAGRATTPTLEAMAEMAS